MTRSIWILNHYAISPDQPGGSRHFDLASELVRLGYDVTILASAFSHDLHRKVRLLGGEPWAVEVVEGVKFVWLPSFAYAGNNWRRAVNMLDYTWRAAWWGRRPPRLETHIPRPDVVLGCSVHLFAVLAGYYLSRHYRSHFLMEVRDLWPQSFIDMGLWREGQLQVRFLRRLEQFLYARAEAIVTLSPLTREYLACYSQAWADKVVCIPNGTRVARFLGAPVPRPRGSGPLQVMYLGAMGVTNGLDLVLKAMSAVDQAEPGLLECVFVGDGPERPRLQQMAKDLALHNVSFQAAVPREQVPAWAAQADILVLVQREVLYGSLNKLYDYMAAGKPIVSALFARHNDPVEEIGCGQAALPEDAADLADKLVAVAHMTEEERQAMGERARIFVRRNHDYSVLAARLADVLESLDERETRAADREATY